MSNYESRECRYETMSIDRREEYFERSAKYRNARHDFAARYARGVAYQEKMGWVPQRAPNVIDMAQKRKAATRG